MDIKDFKHVVEAQKLMNDYTRKLNKACYGTDKFWFALACASGINIKYSDIASPGRVITECKQLYSHIAEAPQKRVTPPKYELEDVKGEKCVVYFDKDCYYNLETDVIVTQWDNKTIEEYGLLLNPETEEELLHDAIVKQKQTVDHMASTFGGGVYKKLLKIK